jgi:pimeloyl-ACP methyl ester carboxylesterase
MWDAQFEPFTCQYQVIRYDMRGFGQSDVPTQERYSPAEDLKALLSHLGIGHGHILGLSRGGAVAIDFALTYPGSTDTLIVADAGLWNFPWESLGETSSQVRNAASISDIGAARRCWLEGALFASALEHPALASRLAQMVEDYSGWHWINDEALDLLEPPPIEQLGNINAPTLIVVGGRDVPDFHKIADTLHRGIPNSSRVVLPGVGHMSNMEDPVRFNRTVLDFLLAK